jgi:hypothetical protein
VNTYLLPCNCGRKIPVEAPQAGEIVACACGASVEVPTLLGLRKLELAEAPPQPAIIKTTWGAGQRLIFLGAIVILIAVAIGVWLFYIRPMDPFANISPDQMKEKAEILSPAQSLHLWEMLDKGGLNPRKRGSEIVFEGMQAQYRIYWWLVGIVAGTGSVLIAAGIVLAYIQTKRITYNR